MYDLGLVNFKKKSKLLNEVGLVGKYIIKIRIFKNRLSITAIIVPVVIYRNY